MFLAFNINKQFVMIARLLGSSSSMRQAKLMAELLPEMELANVLISGENISDIMTHGMGPKPTEKARM
jgi:hypothetical protein